jgi:hypothetical protein
VPWGFEDLSTELFLVRALRASPPGLAASDDDRRRVFSSALQQFDELILASERAGPASSPLTLFYALSQAGRAIAAALCADARWDFEGHGLSAADDRQNVGATVIRPNPRRDRRDAFSVVSDSTGSPNLTAAVQLSRLWASMPHIDRVEGLGADHHEAILLSPEGGGAISRGARIDIPEARLPVEECEAALAKRLAAYPDARGYRYQSLVIATDRGPIGFFIDFPGENGEAMRDVDEIGQPLYGARYLRPAINDAGDLPSPFMSMWLLLFALAHLARYSPAAWTHALDRDRSRLAIPIEKVLASMRLTMPRQVLYAMTHDWGYG